MKIRFLSLVTVLAVFLAGCSAYGGGWLPSPVIFIAVAKVNDWRALQKLNEEIIVDRLQAIGTVGYRIYRNAHDASQALLLVELPDQDDVHHARATVIEALNGLDKVRVTDEWVWEPTDWEAIGDRQKGGVQKRGKV